MHLTFELHTHRKHLHLPAPSIHFLHLTLCTKQLFGIGIWYRLKRFQHTELTFNLANGAETFTLTPCRKNGNAPGGARHPMTDDDNDDEHINNRKERACNVFLLQQRKKVTQLDTFLFNTTK